MTLDVYLVRHGATAWTRTGQHTGRTDLPLLPEGESQASEIAQHLGQVAFAAVFSSDLRRAERTAELVCVPKPQITPLLREYDYGEYEGLTTSEIWARRPGWEIYADGCPGGESPGQVYARARAFLDTIGGLEGAVAAFSHGHFLRALGVAWVGADIGVAAALALDTAAISILREGDRGRLIQRWNWWPALSHA